ncbi:MAG: hypothetical protein JNL11_17375 [Bdellovibrionaceae bacterium]|nr:hypothetical protein [Pseudobdellovibrionaceae bacterium]
MQQHLRFFYTGLFLVVLSSHSRADTAVSNTCMYFYKQDLAIKKYTTDDIKNLRKKYQSLEQKIYWKSFIEDIVDVSQLIHVNFQKKNQEKGSPKRNFELFGIENYKAYVQAREFLSKIPEGSLVMTPELIKQVHIRSASHLKNELNWTQKL